MPSAGSRSTPTDRSGRVPEPVPGATMSVNTDGCAVDDLSFCGGVLVTVGAAMPWDELVATAVERDWVGIEALSGLPGTVGEAVARNASAHGQSVADTLASVRTWDRHEGAQRTFAVADCGLAEGTSRFAEDGEAGPDVPGGGRYLLLDASLLLRQGDLTAPIDDPGLAALVRTPPGGRSPLRSVRAAVLAAGAGTPPSGAAG